MIDGDFNRLKNVDTAARAKLLAQRKELVDVDAAIEEAQRALADAFTDVDSEQLTARSAWLAVDIAQLQADKSWTQEQIAQVQGTITNMQNTLGLLGQTAGFVGSAVKGDVAAMGKGLGGMAGAAITPRYGFQ